MIVVLIGMNNKLSLLEPEDKSNNDLSWDEVFGDVEMTTKNDIASLEVKTGLIDSKLDMLDEK